MMMPTRAKWTIGPLMAAVTFWAMSLYFGKPAQAAESPQEEILKRHGLTLLGPIYVLETEADVKQKLSEVKLLSKQWSQLWQQQRSIMSSKDQQAMIQQMTAQLNQLRAEINAVNQQIRTVPRYRGRLANNYAQEAYAELMATRNQLNLTLNQQNALLGQLKSHPPDPKLKQKIDDEAQAKHDEYVQAVHDLSQLVSATKEKYAALSKNAEVTKALAGLDPAIKPRPQLGPSHDFHETIKLADRYDKDVNENASEPRAKASSRSRRGARSSRIMGTEELPN
jgi:hypothetical protein